MSRGKSSRRQSPLSFVVLFVLMASPAFAGGAVYTDLFEFDCAKNGCDGAGLTRHGFGLRGWRPWYSRAS
jgi:hypothetical protein